MIDLAGVNQHRWLEESGQCFENVNQTHLVLASGKSVLQKSVGFRVINKHLNLHFLSEQFFYR